jgi:hypothetical protein
MLGIHKRCCTTSTLAGSNDLQGQRGFTRGFRAIDFNDTAARQATNPQRNIKPERTRGNGRNSPGCRLIA